MVFQSAPLTKARGDPMPSEETSRRVSFNPLPSQKQGETEGPRLPVLLSLVSIRSPHKSKGRPLAEEQVNPNVEFQSAPLTKARGDPLLPSLNFSIRSFQSAPLTKARGDRKSMRCRVPTTSFNPLPSQKQGETRPSALLENL